MDTATYSGLLSVVKKIEVPEYINDNQNEFLLELDNARKNATIKEKKNQKSPTVRPVVPPDRSKFHNSYRLQYNYIFHSYNSQ